MSEFHMAEISKKTELSTPLVISNFVHFCFYIFSQPIYFSCFIFFTPYIFKLLTFFTPLFISIALLLLVLLTAASPNLLQDKLQLPSDFSDFKVIGFLLRTYQHVLQESSSHKDRDFGCFRQLEAYKIMLETSIFEGLEPKSEAEYHCSYGFAEEAIAVTCSGQIISSSCTVASLEASKSSDFNECDSDNHQEVKKLEIIFPKETDLEDEWCEKRVQQVKPPNPELDKVEHKGRVASIKVGCGSKVIRETKNDHNHNDDMGYASKVKIEKLVTSYHCGKELPKAVGDKDRQTSMCADANYLGSFGSMRTEKEWRRTLACKLFEERNNGSGGAEGMDMLWETHETESPNKVNKSNSKKDAAEYSDEEEERDVDAKLCCLKALKFSAGKINLGMGKPNLMKISKALKGFGRLQHVGKHNKKGRC